MFEPHLAAGASSLVADVTGIWRPRSSSASQYLQIMSQHHDSNDVVELRVPASHEFASVVRLVGASMAADAGFSVDDVDDLRIAVNEMFAGAVLGHGQVSGVVTVRYRSSDAGIEAAFHVEPSIEIVLDELAESIIRVAVDDVSVTADTIVLSKRRMISA